MYSEAQIKEKVATAYCLPSINMVEVDGNQIYITENPDLTLAYKPKIALDLPGYTVTVIGHVSIFGSSVIACMPDVIMGNLKITGGPSQYGPDAPIVGNIEKLPKKANEVLFHRISCLCTMGDFSESVVKELGWSDSSCVMPVEYLPHVTGTCYLPQRMGYYLDFSDIHKRRPDWKVGTLYVHRNCRNILGLALIPTIDNIFVATLNGNLKRRYVAVDKTDPFMFQERLLELGLDSMAKF